MTDNLVTHFVLSDIDEKVLQKILESKGVLTFVERLTFIKELRGASGSLARLVKKGVVIEDYAVGGYRLNPERVKPVVVVA